MSDLSHGDEDFLSAQTSVQASPSSPRSPTIPNALIEEALPFTTQPDEEDDFDDFGGFEGPSAPTEAAIQPPVEEDMITPAFCERLCDALAFLGGEERDSAAKEEEATLEEEAWLKQAYEEVMHQPYHRPQYLSQCKQVQKFSWARSTIRQNVYRLLDLTLNLDEMLDASPELGPSHSPQHKHGSPSLHSHPKSLGSEQDSLFGGEEEDLTELLGMEMETLNAHYAKWQQRRADLLQRLATIENASAMMKEKVELHQHLVEELILNVQAGKVPSLLQSKVASSKSGAKRKTSFSHQPTKLTSSASPNTTTKAGGLKSSLSKTFRIKQRT